MSDFEEFGGLEPGNASDNQDNLEQGLIDEGGATGNEGEHAASEEGEKSPYSPEEVRELLKSGDFAKVDTSRLSEEGRLLMKSFQAGLTPKLQKGAEAVRQAEELARRLAELETKLEEQVKNSPPKTIEEAFDRNPEDTLAWFDQQIASLEEAAPYNKEAEGRLAALKKQQRALVMRGLRTSQERAQQAVQNSEQRANLVAWDAQVRRAIPELEKIAPALAKFAVEELGYDAAKLQELTNPRIAGEAGVLNTLTIHRAWKVAGGEKGMKLKERKDTAPDVLDTGDGSAPVPVKDKVELSKLKKAQLENPTVDGMAAILAAKRRVRTTK